MKTLCLTLDLRGLPVYGAQFDVPLGYETLNPFDAPLRRFLELADALAARATLFVIGLGLREHVTRTTVDAVLAHKHEVASHSFEYDFALAKRKAEHIRSDLAASSIAIREVFGSVPRGIRVPEYILSRTLAAEIVKAGFRWDSSAYSSPLHYGGRAVAIAAYNAVNRTPSARLGPLNALRAPRRPYRVGSDPYRRGNGPLWELPVTGAFGAHSAGTLLSRAPDWIAARWTASLSQQKHLVLGFQTLDFVSADEIPPSLATRRPDTRLDLDSRRARMLSRLKPLAVDRKLTTCSELVERLELKTEVTSD